MHEPDETTTETTEEPRQTVRVPTGRDAHGYHGWIECESAEAAAGWDARRWSRWA